MIDSALVRVKDIYLKGKQYQKEAEVTCRAQATFFPIKKISIQKQFQQIPVVPGITSLLILMSTENCFIRLSFSFFSIFFIFCFHFSQFCFPSLFQLCSASF